MSKRWSTILQLRRATNLTLYAYTISITQYDDSSSCSSHSVAVFACSIDDDPTAEVVVVDPAANRVVLVCY